MVAFAQPGFILSLYPKIGEHLWVQHNITNIIKNLLFALAIYHANSVVPLPRNSSTTLDAA
jgi:hypothetical protein